MSQSLANKLKNHFWKPVLLSLFLIGVPFVSAMEIGDELEIHTKKDKLFCQIPQGFEPCGKGEANFSLTVNETNGELVRGLGSGSIDLRIHQMGGLELSTSEPNLQWSFKSSSTRNFYDQGAMIISGIMIDQNENNWIVDGSGVVDSKKKNKIMIKLRMELEAENGDKFRTELQGFVQPSTSSR